MNRQRGFSFMEVMIAAAMLATLGSSLFGAQDQERIELSRSFERLQAETYAQNTFEVLRIERETLRAGRHALKDLPRGIGGTVLLEEVVPGLWAVRVRIEGERLGRAVELETRIATEAKR